MLKRPKVMESSGISEGATALGQQDNSETMQRSVSREGNTLLHDDGRSQALETQKDEALSNIPEQQINSVHTDDALLGENVRGSPSDIPRILVVPSGDDRPTYPAQKSEGELNGNKVGTYVYRGETLVLSEKAPSIKDRLEETLFKAVRLRKVNDLYNILQDNPPLECRDDLEYTPLLYAVEKNSIEIVLLLLEKKADWNARNWQGQTALHLASAGHCHDTLRLLLDIDGIELDPQDKFLRTPFHLAVATNDRTIAKLLLDAGANVNAKDHLGYTPLHIAVTIGRPIVSMLLQTTNIQIDARANDGRTPLIEACGQKSSARCSRIVKLLLDSNADPMARDRGGRTPLYQSARAGNGEVVAQLISLDNKPIDINVLTHGGRSALFPSIKRGDTDIVRQLLQAGINSEYVDTKGRTALLESSKYDRVEILRLILKRLEKQRVQDHKTDLQALLFEAAIHDSPQVAGFLIEKGASMEEKEPSTQKTAIEIADHHGSQKVVAVLLEKGDQLVGPSPFVEPPLEEFSSETELSRSAIEIDSVDLAFGFQSTIASFPYDTRRPYRIKRPRLRDVLYDHSADTIRYGLNDAESQERNFRWLHVPSNNIVWVNKLISRIFKECHPPGEANRLQEKCRYLFGEEIWTRHQYQMSSTSVAHRRFIRPICQRVVFSERDKNNMMMVLPYIHWETNDGRKQMTDAIVEAMKRHLEEPQSQSGSDGLEKAIKELENIRNPKVDDTVDTSSGNPGYHTYLSYTHTSSSLRGTQSMLVQDSEFPSDLDSDWLPTIASETLDNEIAHARRATGEKREEQEERRRRRMQRIVRVTKEPMLPDAKLILAYMFDEFPLHFRRTLDQYCYYTLPTTEARDIDQVVSRYHEKIWPEEQEEKSVLMVDQLWLWILDNDTVVTSFPQRWNKTGKKSARDPDPHNYTDIVESIIRHIGRKDRRPLTNVFDLAELIVGTCVRTMFEHPDIANEKLRFAEFFEVSIGNVANEESKMFNDFAELSKRLAKAKQDRKNSHEQEEDLKKLFDISEETELVKEIKDIRDELHIISAVLEDQEKVLVDMEEAFHAMKASETDSVEPKKIWTTPSIHSIPERVRAHKAAVKGLDKQAEKTYVALKDLLDLKQKQANVSEARTQGKQTAETARQSQTLMLFTIITVFFLPLSFMSSFLDLDIAEFVRNDNGELSLAYVSIIMFTITISVVLMSLFLAFHRELPGLLDTYCYHPLRCLYESLGEYMRTKATTVRPMQQDILFDRDEFVLDEATSRKHRLRRPSYSAIAGLRVMSALLAFIGVRIGAQKRETAKQDSQERSPLPQPRAGWSESRQSLQAERLVVAGERPSRRTTSSSAPSGSGGRWFDNYNQ